jgi:DeoR/GlpR family transcriptional regulator of sugar metabolism
LVGPLTGKILEALHFDKAFMGTIGLTPGGGMSTTDPNEAYTKEVVMKRARKVILLADSSKLGIDSFAASGSVRDIDVIVTDSRISAACRRAFTKLGVKVVTSDA